MVTTLPDIGDRKIAIVLDNPSMEEVEHGESLIDGKGTLLKETLKEIGVSKDDVCILYACCCSSDTNRSPSGQEINCCKLQLEQSIHIFQPDVIVPLGMLALKAFNPNAISIEDNRGVPFVWNTFTVIPTYSPGYVLRYHDAFTLFKQDLLNAFTKDSFVYRQPKIELLPVIDQVSVFDAIYELKKSTTLSIDIETTGLCRYNDAIRLMGIEGDNGISYQFPFGVLYLSMFRPALKELLEDANIIKVAHNGISFDAPFIEEQLGIKCKIDFDTMLLHYLLDERKGTHNLGFIGRNYLFAPEYKSMIKDYAAAPMDDLSYYLGYDTAITYDLLYELRSKLTLKQTKLYSDYIHPLAEAFATMNKRGALIDKQYLLDFEQRLEHQYNRLCKIIQIKSGVANPNSSQQVASYIYNVLRKPPHRKIGRTTSKSYIATFDHKVINLIIKARELKKLQSTYCQGIIKRLSPDGRIRTSYLIHGTVSDRVSSVNPNLQNIPRDGLIKRAFTAPEGYMFVEADYSQLELRVAAWYSGEDRLIESFRNGVDIHTQTAAFMFSKPLDEVTPEQRFAAKSINFGVLFGMGADKLAATLKCDYSVAVKYLQNWHITYPKLSAWIKEVEDSVYETGFVENPIGSIRRFPLITNGNRNEVNREAVNTKVQGFAGAICLNALIKLTDSPNEVCGIETALTVHDSIGCYVKYDEKFNTRVQLVKDTMENSIYNMGFQSPIKFEVDIKFGKNWGETEKWKS